MIIRQLYLTDWTTGELAISKWDHWGLDYGLPCASPAFRHPEGYPTLYSVEVFQKYTLSTDLGIRVFHDLR
jgi:hypothetical protein